MVDIVCYSTFIEMDILGQSECAISQTIMTLLLGLISFASITYTISSNTDSHVPKVAWSYCGYVLISMFWDLAKGGVSGLVTGNNIDNVIYQ